MILAAFHIIWLKKLTIEPVSPVYVFLQNGDEARPQLWPAPTIDMSVTFIVPLMNSLVSCFLLKPNQASCSIS